MPVGFLAVKAEAQTTTSAARPKMVINKTIRHKIKYTSTKHKAKQKHDTISGESYDGSSKPQLSSDKALIVSQKSGRIKYSKNSHAVAPIASITKLMTAMVVLDAHQPFDDDVRITKQDVDTIKNTWSRLKVGATLTRAQMFQLALMASENRAAFALARSYPGGRKAFVKAMNKKALRIGLADTHFTEPTGLMYQNTSTAEDLYKLVAAAYRYPEIRNATTTPLYNVRLKGNKNATKYKNTNSLVREGEWDIGLSKTGFIDEAGRCLVMQATVDGEPIIAIFLDAEGAKDRTSDANRIRKWIEYNHRAKTHLAKNRVLKPKLAMSNSILEN